MKLKQLESDISQLFASEAFEVETEFVTADNSRVDLAVHRHGGPLLAVEFEESYKWMRARVLYDSIKADREGFPQLAVVYPFEQRGLESGWIWDFIEDDLDLSTDIVRPDDVSSLKENFVDD